MGDEEFFPDLRKEYKAKYEAAKSKAETCLSNHNKYKVGDSIMDIAQAKYWMDQYNQCMDEYYTYKQRYDSLT